MFFNIVIFNIIIGIIGFLIGSKIVYPLLKFLCRLFEEDILRRIKAYRKFRGGTWYYYKLGKDTPLIGMFSHWTKNEITSDSVVLLDTETYWGIDNV